MTMENEIAKYDDLESRLAKKDRLIEKLQATVVASINKNQRLRQKMQQGATTSTSNPEDEAPGNVFFELGHVKDRLLQILEGW